MVKTNDLKTGTRIQLANGWFATLKDNQRGNIRIAEVEGWFTEIGSIYAHDIVAALVDGIWQDIEYTPSQLRCRRMNQALFS